MKLGTLFTCALLTASVLVSTAQAQAIVAIDSGGGGGRGGPPRPSPVPPPRLGLSLDSPAYQNITDQVWIADRTQLVQEWVEITPGRLEQVWRQVVIPGHWETTTRRVLIADGHWELVQINPFPQPPIVIVPSPPPRHHSQSGHCWRRGLQQRPWRGPEQILASQRLARQKVTWSSSQGRMHHRRLKHRSTLLICVILPKN